MLAGNGPCNKDRLGARVKAWDDGAWFREGLVAHAEKAAARRAARRRRITARKRARAAPPKF